VAVGEEEAAVTQVEAEAEAEAEAVAAEVGEVEEEERREAESARKAPWPESVMLRALGEDRGRA
jgi:hypothetical protein